MSSPSYCEVTKRCPLWKEMGASLSAVYMIASIFYIVATRNIGTPFKDSLTEEQRQIKHVAANLRGRIFGIGILVGVLIVMRLK